ALREWRPSSSCPSSPSGLPSSAERPRRVRHRTPAWQRWRVRSTSSSIPPGWWGTNVAQASKVPAAGQRLSDGCRRLAAGAPGHVRCRSPGGHPAAACGTLGQRGFPVFAAITRIAGVLLAGLLVLLLAVSCATVALTGRRQLDLLPDSEVLSASTQQYDQFMKENQLSSDAEQTARIKRVGARIQAAVEEYVRRANRTRDLAGYAWEFNLVKSKEVNAWCMPGGKVVFYTGIMPVCRDDNGVAVVMGHEVAHAVAKHGAERMTQNLIAQAGGLALGAALHSRSQETQRLWMSAFGVGAQY